MTACRCGTILGVVDSTDQKNWSPFGQGFQSESGNFLKLPHCLIEILRANKFKHGEVLVVLVFFSKIRPGSFVVTLSYKEIRRHAGVSNGIISRTIAKMVARQAKIIQHGIKGTSSVYDFEGFSNWLGTQKLCSSRG